MDDIVFRAAAPVHPDRRCVWFAGDGVIGHRSSSSTRQQSLSWWCQIRQRSLMEETPADSALACRRALPLSIFRAPAWWHAKSLPWWYTAPLYISKLWSSDYVCQLADVGFHQQPTPIWTERGKKPTAGAHSLTQFITRTCNDTTCNQHFVQDVFFFFRITQPDLPVHPSLLAEVLNKLVSRVDYVNIYGPDWHLF